MITIVLASHGELAQGVLNSSQMIVGHQENIKACCLLPSESPEDINKKMRDAISSFEEQEEVLFLVDLWGGTPFNQASLLVKENPSWMIVTGLNLPMAIEALMQRNMETSAKVLGSKILESAISSIQSFPEKIEVKKENSQEVVSCKDSIDYVLARIDSRLLHGQVATGWTKSCNPDRILVVSDSVSHDDLRKKMIKQAAPVGVKAHVIPIYKLVEINSDPRFYGMKALLLFENAQDVLKVIQAGVSLPKINLGSIAYKEGKYAVSNAVAMSKEDVETFKELLKLGISIDVRKVPGDSPEDFDAMLKKAESLIARDKK